AMIGGGFGKSRTDLVLHKVQYDRLPLTIVEQGTLESQNNNDIVCRVKARAQGSNVASTIKWVIDDGTHVKSHRPASEAALIYEWNPQEARYDEKAGSGSWKVVQLKDPKNGVYYADLLADLDDSGLQDTLKTQKITVDKAESEKIQAEEKYKI